MIYIQPWIQMKAPVLQSTIWETILGLQPRDKVAMLGVNTIEFFLKEFTWK